MAQTGRMTPSLALRAVAVEHALDRHDALFGESAVDPCAARLTSLSKSSRLGTGISIGLPCLGCVFCVGSSPCFGSVMPRRVRA